ncbi:hypothetical protein X777_08863 [Ooceraea biroi]|uniref:Uncharacterized protein n=6 Tax=Formicidae TaxID=36668 RepID=A0A026W9I6_OOCBI|nr:hypothetical protein X777_08863 [Ooceraea biroi]
MTRKKKCGKVTRRLGSRANERTSHQRRACDAGEVGEVSDSEMAGDETAVSTCAAPSDGARARHGTLQRRRRRWPRRADESETCAGRRPFVSAVRVVRVDDGDGDNDNG